jgi:predicted patatin/cPLA2 family phospholipase
VAIRKFDHQTLLLQGGGALGAYHAGVYEDLTEARLEPNWVVGVSGNLCWSGSNFWSPPISFEPWLWTRRSLTLRF